MSLAGIASSLSGMQTAILRQNITANNIANISTSDFKAGRAVQTNLAGGGTMISATQADFPNVDLATETVQQILALRTFQFNAQALRAQDEMLGTLLDLRQ